MGSEMCIRDRYEIKDIEKRKCCINNLKLKNIRTVYTWYTRGAGPRRADAHLGFGVPVMAEDVRKSRS